MGQKSCPRASPSCPADGNFKGSEIIGTRLKVVVIKDAESVRQPDARRTDPSRRQSRNIRRSREPACSGSATRRVTSSGWERPAWCTTSSRAAGFRLQTSRVPGRSPRRFSRTISRKYPRAHERSRVLASVPGSDQAMEAVLLAQIPKPHACRKKAHGAQWCSTRAIQCSSRSRRRRSRAR